MMSEHLLNQDPRLRLEYGQMMVDIPAVLSTLKPREAEILDLYFGLSSGRRQSLDSIAHGMSLSRERVRQIKAKAIRRLRYSTRADILYRYW